MLPTAVGIPLRVIVATGICRSRLGVFPARVYDGMRRLPPGGLWTFIHGPRRYDGHETVRRDGGPVRVNDYLPRTSAATRSRIICTYAASLSIEIERMPHFDAATTPVPLPLNRSSSNPPGFPATSNILSMTARGLGD